MALLIVVDGAVNALFMQLMALSMVCDGTVNVVDAEICFGGKCEEGIYAHYRGFSTRNMAV